MPTVDFVYDTDCPHVKAARANLMRAFSRAGISAHWSEHQIGSSDAPDHVRGFGSPTVLVNGVDAAGLTPGAEDCCRIYDGDPVPSVQLLTMALQRPTSEVASGEHAATPPRSRWKSTAAVLPGIGVALMPKVVCPMCWPAYVGVLSATGLTFLLEDRWLVPTISAFLLAALAGLAWRARTRRGYGPLCVGVASATAILAGKFAMDSTTVVYTGIGALVVACVWNVWPRRSAQPNCPACRATVAG